VWELRTHEQTLCLPEHKATRLQSLIDTYLPLRRTSRTKWQRLLGELRHMATAIPGAKHLFSILQHVLIDQKAPRIRLSPIVKHSLSDWKQLATELATKPIQIQTLVPNLPTFLGAVNASGEGLGGFWLPMPDSRDCTPIIFRHRFPPSATARLITASKPSKDITNSDLELAALVTGADILRDTYPTAEHATLLCASDNAAAVAWSSKGSTSSTKARAYLLRWLAQISCTKDFTLNTVFKSGTANTLADCCSRSFAMNDQDFSDHILCRFPTANDWRHVHPTNTTNSNMISALSCEMLPGASPVAEPTLQQPLGTSGAPSA